MSLNKYFSSFVAGVIILAGCATSGNKVPQSDKEFAGTSVKVTLENKSSGGTGVIVKSNASGSWILTNRHVCNLVQVGGIVTTDNDEDYAIHSFQVYKRHDLCLVKVVENLHVNNMLAESAPKLYDPIIIAGHPHLLPTMITKGHVTHDIPITLMVDVKECDGTEGGQEEFFCALFGKKPIFATFTATPTTATIMAGSSGSPVYNAQGQVSALVFAGNEGLSYGFLVPYAYVRDFMTNLGRYPIEYPGEERRGKSLFADVLKIERYCMKNRDKCEGFSLHGIY